MNRCVKWLDEKLNIRFLPYCIFAAAALIAYCNSFTVPFLLDDFGSISNNYAIHTLFDFPALWKFYANRIVLYFTFSLNYAVHDNGVEGYHIINLLIHIFNGIIFYWILLRLFSLPYFKGKLISGHKKVVAVLAVVLFLCHPIQVNAVTYIVQRTASLAATFYLLAMLFFLRFRMHDKWYNLLLTFIFTVLAMFTKENTITIPFMLLLLEFMFFLKDGKTSWVKRILIFIPIFATVPIIPGTNLFLSGYSQSDPNVSFKASTSMDRFQYFYTQLNVILLYIRLMFIPYGQNFDYSNDFPISITIWDNYSYVSFIILLLIGLYALYTYKRNRLVSLGILWFFMGLAVESSFISIKDVYFEHRLYYPTAGFVLSLIGLIMYERKGHDEKIEQDQKQCSEANMKTYPEKLYEKYNEAISEDSSEKFAVSLSDEPATGRSLSSDPSSGSNEETSSDSNYSCPSEPSTEITDDSSNETLSAGLTESNESVSIEKHIKNQYILKKPLSVLLVIAAILIPAYTGLTIYRNYIYGDSIRLWSDVVKKAPGSDRAHSVLASGYLNEYSDEKGNIEYLDLAEKEFKIAIDMNKSNSTAHCNLSKVYLLKKEYDKCIDEAKATLRITNSEYAAYNLGTAYKEMGKLDDALKEYLKGYSFNNRSSFILKSLGETYYEINDLENAKRYYEEYLEVNKRYNNKDIEDKLDEIKSKIDAENI